MSSTSLRRVGSTRKPRLGSWASQPSWASSSRASRTGVILMPSCSAMGPRRRMSPGLTCRLRIRSRTTDATPCLSCSRRIRSRISAIRSVPSGRPLAGTLTLGRLVTQREHTLSILSEPGGHTGTEPLRSAYGKTTSERYFVPADQLAGDHVALDLVGALTDDHERRVPEVALNIKFGRVAVAAENTDRVQRDLHGGLGGEQLGHARLQVGPLTGVVAAGGVQDQLAGGGELGGHVGQVVADRLVLPDRLAERLPLLGVAQGVLERGPADAEGPARDLDAAHLQAAHHLREPPPFRVPQQG